MDDSCLHGRYDVIVPLGLNYRNFPLNIFPLFFFWLQRQGLINSYEDPRMACGFQSNYHPQRTCYPFWEEMATQEVPTGLEHCGSGRNIKKG